MSDAQFKLIVIPTELCKVNLQRDRVWTTFFPGDAAACYANCSSRAAITAPSS